MDDKFYMKRALEIARRGRFTTTPNPNVGCVIVLNGTIVGEGYHSCAGKPHAEIYALQMAGEKAKTATVYVTLEPCNHYGRTPPCCEALISAGVHRVVIAMQDPNPLVAGRGLAKLKAAGIKVNYGLMEVEAERLNKGFLKRMRTGLPFLQLKLAASLDGRTAMANGESKWITSLAARLDVQIWRAQSSAILSSSATVLIDNPALTVRWNELDSATKKIYPLQQLRQPVRIIIDSKNRIRPHHRLMLESGKIWLMRKSVTRQHFPSKVEQIIIPCNGEYIDLNRMMYILGQKQINTIWVEAGAKLSGALLQYGMVDEFILYLAPKILGNNARNLCYLPELNELSNILKFDLKEIYQVGPDLRLHLIPKINLEFNLEGKS
ncbi:MAG: bifunctional diaminohydroxyphosphoribosylaminopyrimidine deaminase/5-amino-6-(5-phosphoribosylamino)uracil reductase RibD [Candidatus Dasytiphilus stammeri]